MTNLCQVKSENSQDGAYEITNFINATTTADEFEAYRTSKEFCEKYPKYQIYFGGRCGWNVFCSCAAKGNAHLLKYLLETYGKMFANVGNEFGWTPIFCATTCSNEDLGLACIDVLLAFGADVTIATSFSAMGDYMTWKGTTPLQNCISLKRKMMVDILQQVVNSAAKLY